MEENEPLLPQAVRQQLSTSRFGQRIYYMPEVDSTNRVAAVLAGLGEAEGTVVVAEVQHEGRGRLDRTWESPPQKNLLFSVILRPRQALAEVLTLTLACATAVSEALSRILDREVGVRWPNDVVCDGRKLCGILAESSSRAGKAAYVIMGIGINVNVVREDFSPSIRKRAASCRTLTGKTYSRVRVLTDVLLALEQCYSRFCSSGFGAFADRYNEKLSLVGKTVSFEKSGRTVTGAVVGVRTDGALEVSPAGVKSVLLYSEEISLV